MIKVGIVGCGRVAEHHCKAILKTKGIQIKAVCDLNYKKAEYLSKIYKTKLYTNYHQMLLENKDINLVSIITPTGMHYEHSIDIIKKYKRDLLIEKPICLNTKNLIKIYKLAKSKRVKIFPVFQNRYNIATQRLATAVKNKEIGEIRTINVTVRWCRPQRYYNLSPWRGTYSHDGGALTNQGIHYVNILNYMASEITELSCISATLGAKIEVEDTAVAIFKLKNKGVGTLEITTAARPDDFEGSITIVGSKGLAKISGFALNNLEIFSPNPKEQKKYSDSYKDLADRGKVYGRGHFNTYEDVVLHYRRKRKYPVNFKECFKSINFLNALYCSYEKNGKWIKLNKINISKRLGKSSEKISKIYRTKK